jgi:hypothetical protein
MAVTLKSLGIDKLALEDRLTLVNELWESIAAETAERSRANAQRRSLESSIPGMSSGDDSMCWVDADFGRRQT